MVISVPLTFWSIWHEQLIDEGGTTQSAHE